MRSCALVEHPPKKPLLPCWRRDFTSDKPWEHSVSEEPHHGTAMMGCGNEMNTTYIGSFDSLDIQTLKWGGHSHGHKCECSTTPVTDTHSSLKALYWVRVVCSIQGWSEILNPVSQGCDLWSHLSTHWGYINCSSLLKRLWKKGQFSFFLILYLEGKVQCPCTLNSYLGNRLLAIWLWTSWGCQGKEHIEAL